MPLHLLSKKSWNVYAPENIARVKRDEAAAQAAEEEADRRMQEYDAERRLAILRGEALPAAPVIEAEKPCRRDEERGAGRDRKRKRIAGEDDTERDLRVAREDIEDRQRPHALTEAKKTKTSNAPITDHAGHINLFPVDPRGQTKNAEVEAEKARKQREMEDQYTMRLDNAAGRDGFKEKPWYASATLSKVDSAQEAVDEAEERSLKLFGEGKNVWGRPDPRRKDREVGRISAADPLAFMSKAQTQLKRAEIDRRKWAEEREREMLALKKEAEKRKRREKQERREKRKHRDERTEENDLEGFSLDAAIQEHSRHSDEKKNKDSKDRSRDREKRHSHHGEQDRSRDRSSRHKVLL